MRYLFRTFKSGQGDCIFLHLNNNGQEVHIMVDCGKYEPEINKFLEDKFNNVIDYLIVTHIDNDHINGLITMLSKKTNLTIRHILYNCYQRSPNKLEQWSDRMKENVLNVYRNLPVVVDMVEQKIHEDAAVTLAENILNNEEWKNVWRRDYITDKTAPIVLEGNMGRLIFLSPSQQALDNLDIQYRKMFWKHLYKQKCSDFNKEENIYEALMRIVHMEEEEPEDCEIGVQNIDEHKLNYYALEELGEMSITNKASIAFVWEHQEHRILFLGDAAPVQVCNALGKVYEDMQKPILFDIIKVSHHGSAHSTSSDLINMADSERFFFTGGSSSKSPSIQALSRIVTAKIPNGIKNREIRYNRENEALISLANTSNELKKKLRFSVYNDKNSYEISY